MLSSNEMVRISRFLDTHFSENLKMRFVYQGQEVSTMFTFHPNFMLGIACYIVDQNGLNTGSKLVKEIRPSEDGFFKCEFELNKINGFDLVQIVQVLELLFDVPMATNYKPSDTPFDLSPLVESLLQQQIQLGAEVS